MTARSVSVLLVTLSAAATACGGPAYVEPSPRLPAAITEHGERIYRGRVYALEGEPDAPTYVYERRVADDGERIVATHVTRDGAGVVQLAESAEHAPDYSLASYTLHANQLGQVGDIRVSGGEVAFRVLDKGIERRAVEHVDAPVVVGPTLIGYMVEHMDELVRGRTLAVRMAVIDRLETIGFELESAEAPVDQVRVRMSPSSFLIGLAVAPIDFAFDRETRSLISLDGRVPTKVRDGDHWADFDAHVEYDMLVARYR